MVRKGQIPWNKGLKVGIITKGAFKKGHIPWNNGLSKQSNESLRKISESMKGRKLLEEIKKKVSEGVKKLWQDPDYRAHQIKAIREAAKPRRGIPKSEETRKRMSEAQKGKTSFWKGKKQPEDYLKRRIEGVRKACRTPEFSRKMSIQAIKQMANPAARKSISEVMKGKKKPVQQIRKMIETKKMQFQNNPELREQMRLQRLKQVFPKKDTKPERMLQHELFLRGIKFETHKAIIGQPDIFLVPNNCILIDGDFWHANPKKFKPNSIIIGGLTAQEIWRKDNRISNELKKNGYNVLRLWESEIELDLEGCIKKIHSFVPKLSRQEDQKKISIT